MKKFNFDDVRINLEKDLNRAYGTTDVLLYCFFVTHDENNIKYEANKRPGCFVLLPRISSSYFKNRPSTSMEDVAFDLIDRKVDRYSCSIRYRNAIDKALFDKKNNIKTYSLELFCGVFPDGENQNSPVYIKPFGMEYSYTVLHYVAFGATAKINPNLISSWGYELKL